MSEQLELTGFEKRASHVVSNAGLYQLVQEMARELEAQRQDIVEIKEMCRNILKCMKE